MNMYMRRKQPNRHYHAVIIIAQDVFNALDTNYVRTERQHELIANKLIRKNMHIHVNIKDKNIHAGATKMH